METRRKQDFKIPKTQRSRAGTPSIGEPASKEISSDSAESFETAVCFLHIQLIGTNVRLPIMHNIPSSPRSILNLEDLLRNRSPEIIPICTVVQSVFPVTILPTVTRTENVVDQTSSVSATCSCPCCVCSFQFVQRPQNIWSANACQIQACLRRFESTLLTTLSPFPAVFFHDVVVVKTWC